MSMYKNIFVNEEYDGTAEGAQVLGVNGEVLIFGQSAFASLDEATKDADIANSVIRVTTGAYDEFYVADANENIVKANRVVAMDFTGGVVENADGVTVEVAAPTPEQMPVEKQQDLIADLNDAYADKGIVFVDAEKYSAADQTLVIGWEGTDYVPGTNNTDAVFGKDNLFDLISNSVIEVDKGGADGQLLVSADYNSSTEGYGVTKFNSYKGAYAYATANAKTATIVVEKTTTISGNAFENNHKNYTKLAVVVKNGATVGNALSKWDMTYAVTVEAGGKIEMARPASASVSYMHIKNKLTIGEAGEGKKTAYLDFLSDAYQDGDISIRYNGSIVANNAKIRVQDLDAQGKLTLTDTELTVDGAFATATSLFYATTFTRVTATVGGTQISGGLSDFAGGDSNQLGNFKMIDSTLTFGAGAKVKIAANVTLSGKSTLDAGNLTINKNKTLTMDSTSTLVLDDLAGEGTIKINLLEGFVPGTDVIRFRNGDATAADAAKIKFSSNDGKEYAALVQNGNIVAIVQAAGGKLDLDSSNAGTENDVIAATQISNTSKEDAVVSAQVVGEDITIDNEKGLAITGSVKADKNVTIENIAAEGADKEAVLNGGSDDKAAKISAGEKITFTNNGHAVVELSAKDIEIENNSRNTITNSTIGYENEVIVADNVSITAAENADGVVSSSKIGANGVVTLADQTIKDTTITGWVHVTGDVTFDKLDDTKNTNTVILNDTTTPRKALEVNNGAIMTVAAGSVLNIQGYQYLFAGNDTWNDLRGDASKGGTIVINGTVNVSQANANDQGLIVVNNGGYLKVAELCVESGSVTDAAAGELRVAGGTVDTKSLRVFAGSTVNVLNGGLLKVDNPHTGNDTGSANVNMTIRNASTLNVENGGKVYLDESGQIKDNATLNINGGTLEVAGNFNTDSEAKLNVNGGLLKVDGTLTNNSIINVSGTSDLNVANKVTGDGMIYMDGVTLDSDTKLDGANVRFASGVNTIDGATIDNGKFQIGQGQYGNTDGRIDMENGVTVNVRNNAHIGAKDGDYNGWVGTGFFDSDAEKLAAMTDAEYTLNIDNSTAEFGYLHISNDGVMNVTGVADQKLTHNNSDYSFYTGRLIINGEAKFDGADVLAFYTTVSCDNGTENGGHLIITNGSYYEAESHDGANDSKLNLDVRKTGVVDVNGGSTLYVGGKASIAENAAVNVNGAIVKITGTVTNSGTFTIAGESTVNIATLSGNALQVLDGATLKDSTISGEAYLWIMKNATFAGNISIHGNLYGQSEAVLDIAGGAVVTVKNDICFRDGSTLNLATGSVVTAKALSIGGSTLNVNGGSFSAYVENYHPELTAQINISNGGSVTLTNAHKDLSISLDGTSTLTLTGTAYQNFTFDVAGLSDQEGVFKKLVDVMSDSVTVDFSTALSDNENLIVLGNDLYYSTVNTDVLYVNSAYTQPAGTQLDDGKIIGFNAFSNITDAIKAAEKNGGATINLGNESRPDAFGNVSSSNPVLHANGTYTFTGGNYADLAAWIQPPKPSEASDVDVNIVFDGAKVIAGKFRLDNGVTLTITDSHIDARSYIGDNRAWNTYYGDSKIVINNSVVGYHAAWAGNSAGNSEAITAGDKDTDYSGIQAGMFFGGSGVMTVENSTIFAFTEGTNGYGSLGVMDKGLMEFKNSAVYAYGFTVGRASTGGTTVGRDNEVATMILDNSVLRNTNGDASGNIFIGNADYAGKLVLKNGAKLYQEQATMNIAQKGEVEIDGSALNLNAINNAGVITIDAVSMIKANTITNNGTVNITDNSTLTANSITNNNELGIFDSTLSNVMISGSGYVRAENAVLSNLTVTGQETRTVNTNFNGGTYTGKVYTGYGLVNGEWVRVTDSESTVMGTVDASSVYWQNYGKLTIAEGAELKTSYFSEASTQVLTVNGTITAGTFRGYNGIVSETGKINAQAAVQFYGNPDTQRKYDINGEVVVTHDIAYAHNIVVGFNTAKQWYGDGPNDYWNIGGANTEVNVSGEKAKLQIVAGKAGKGTAIIHVDEEGTKATLNVSNKAQFLVDGEVINNGNLNIVDATFSTGSFENTGSFYANANSTVTVTGNFTSTTDLTFNGNVTIDGTLTVDNLTLSAGSNVTVNNLVVNKKLNFVLGAALTITDATLGNFNLTVNGTLSASEYELVKGWEGEYDNTITFKGVEYTLDEASGIYKNENDTNITFVIKDGVLILKDKAAQAAAGSVLIDSSLTAGASVVIDGIRYTEGTNAFTSVDVIPDDKLITGVVLTNADVDAKLNSTALKDVQTVTVQGTKNTIDATVTDDTGYTLNVGAGSMLTGTGLFDVNGDMMINNDGHLDTNATASGAMKIVNTSANTLKGTYTATDLIIDNQVSGAIEGATLNGTVSTAISGGTGTGVTVYTPHLSLTDTKFEIKDGSILSTHTDGESGAESETGILLKGDTDLTIRKAGEISATIREAADNVGNTTLTTVGTQTYTGDIEVDKIIIGNEVKTTITGTADFSDLDLNGELTVDMTAGTEYTEAGRINGEGILNLTHKNAWIVNDTVNRDFSGFTGTVNMTGADTKQIVLGLGDAPVAVPASSYFADGTTVNVAAGQEIYLAGDDVDTAIKFAKDGTINVGELDPSLTIQDGITAKLAEFSGGFTQTLSGDNSDFTGTVNVSEDTELTIANKLGATAINMNVKVSATGDTDDTKLNLKYDGLALAAKIAGDTNDQINVQESATLEAAGAIDGFSGTVNVTDKKTLNLTGVNNTAAIFNGSDTTTLDLDADTTLTADTAINGFSGTIDMTQETEVATSLTLNGENSTAATFVGATVDTINANADTTLTAAGALKDYAGTVNVADDKAVTLTGANTTDAKFVGGETADLNLDANTVLNAEGAINEFSGKVDMTQETEVATSLTLNGENTTAAKFVGADVDIINANADTTLTAAGALNDYAGTVNVADEKTVNLTGVNTTAAIFNGSTSTTLDLDADTTLTADKALDGFSGTVDMTQETEVATNLTVSGANTTAAIFKGADADVINVGTGGNTNTFTAAGAVNAFEGTINVAEGATLTLNGGNTTDAAINLGTEIVPNVTTLNLANTNVLNGAITGDTDDVIKVVDSTTTLTADNTGFVGDTNIGANATLILQNSFGMADDKADTGKMNFAETSTLVLDGAGIQVGAALYGDINDTVTVKQNATLTEVSALDNYSGTVDVQATLTTAKDNATSAIFKGAGIINADAALTLGKDAALNDFTGTVTLENSNVLTLNGVNSTAVTFVGNTGDTIRVNKNTTLTGEGALNRFAGTINMTQDTESAQTLTLTQENTTAATLTGSAADKLVVQVDNTFSGDVSGFAGLYDIATDAELTLSGTFANDIRANGDTLTLSGNAKNDATTTVTAESALANLNIDDNNVTLATGDFYNVYGEAGSKLSFTGDFNDDITSTRDTKGLVDVKVGTVYITDEKDILVTDEFVANVDMTINSIGATNAASDLTLSGNEADIAIGAIELHHGTNIAISAAGDQNYYYLITGSGNSVSDAESIKIDGEEVKVGQSLLHSKDGNRYFLNIIEGTGVEHLVLVSKVGYSNYVTVNGAWNGKPDGAEVTDAAGTVRNINYDAAASMDAAIDRIRGNNNWNKTTEEGGKAKGAAQIELDVNGEYAITEVKYLMDAANGVTDLTINGREGANAVVITSDIYGSDGNRLYKDTGLDTVTSLTLKNVTTYGNIYGGGKLTIDNSSNASAWTSGSVVVAGINGGTTRHDTELVLNGGYFTSTYLSGGSWALADNVTAQDSKIVINGGVTAIGTIIGGGYATKDKTLTQGDATVEINATGKISLGGNIYAGGGIATGGKLTVGNRTVILSGDAEKLAFTGTVYGSAYGKDKTDIEYNGSTATIAFKDWTGKFNGSLADFNTLLISGDTSLEFARRQNKTAETGITFDVGGRTNTTDAMYTVRDANRWEFRKTITVNTTNAATGDYILVSNWNGGYNGFTFTIDGANCTLGGYAGNSKLDVVDGNLVLSVLKTADVNADGTITIDSTEPTLITGTVTDAATTNNSAAVNVTADDAVVSNAGTINGAATQGSVAIRIGAEGASVTEAAVENSGTIEALDKEKYNRAVYSYAKELTVENAGTINGEIYQNVAGATSLEVNNSGTITAMTSTMGSDTVVSTSNGQIVLSGANGTYELKRNTVTDNFGGDVISGQNGILVSADNTTIKAGTDVSVGTATVKGLYNDSYGHIKIDGDNNKIEIINAKSAYGIYEFSYTEQDSNVHITGDNNAISVKSSNSAIGICNRFGDVIITGSGTKISVESSNTYAYGIHTQNNNSAEGDIIIGEFNADGSVAKASDIQLTVTGKTSTNSTPVMSPIAVYAKKGTAKIALAEDGLISCAGFDAISAGQVQLTNAGTIIGNVKATGSSTDDFIAMDVDAVLNGAMTGVDKLTLSGITGLATDVAGAKAIIGSVDDVLNSAMIDGASVTIGGDVEEIATNVWASLTKVDNSLVVAWGCDRDDVTAALTAFEEAWKNDKLAIGESLVADASGLADNDYSDCFQLDDKKSKGTLA